MTVNENAIRATGELIQRYAAPIILAPPPSVKGQEFHNASGVFVELQKKYFFVTALHVVQDFTEILEREPELLAHLGYTQFHPRGRLAHSDADADVAFLAVTQDEAEAVGSWIYHPPDWPPVTPGIETLVGIAGYPKVIRVQRGEKQWEFRGFVTQTPITSLNDRQFSCVFNRDEWVELGAPGGLEAKDLGGISGGPVFAIGGIQPRLVGVVAEHGADFDILFAGRLDRTSISDLGLTAE